MTEKAGQEIELTDNLLRDQLNASFEKARIAIETLKSLVKLGDDDIVGQRQLARAIYDISEFETTYRMAQNDDFKAVSANPRVPWGDSNEEA